MPLGLWSHTLPTAICVVDISKQYLTDYKQVSFKLDWSLSPLLIYSRALFYSEKSLKILFR